MFKPFFVAGAEGLEEMQENLKWLFPFLHVLLCVF